jgi:hypothetical protein
MTGEMAQWRYTRTGEAEMASFKMKADDLFDSHNRKVATVRGHDVFDDHNRKVATVRGNEILDGCNHKVATVRGSDVFDAHNRKLTTLNDARKAIDGVAGGVTAAALWLFFIR